eukprot:6186837-Pleurochrysis_carterae.AAC.1
MPPESDAALPKAASSRLGMRETKRSNARSLLSRSEGGRCVRCKWRSAARKRAAVAVGAGSVRGEKAGKCDLGRLRGRRGDAL